MSASNNPSAFVFNYDAESLKRLCLFDFELSHDPMLFAYSFKAMPGKRLAPFFPICHSQSTIERIDTKVSKVSDVYHQLYFGVESIMF
jgi:hypothetical protein